MRKRVDNDATQEVSASMLVPPAKPPALGSIPKNDASMWMQTQVSAADFVGAAKKKSTAGVRRTMVVGVLALVLLAGAAGGVWYAFLRESPLQTAASPAPTPASAPAPAPAPPPAPEVPAVAAATDDAGVADAAVAEAVDAGTPTVGALQADAVSAADPVVKKKPTKKRATAKKKVVKKKTATTPKKR